MNKRAALGILAIYVSSKINLMQLRPEVLQNKLHALERALKISGKHTIFYR